MTRLSFFVCNGDLQVRQASGRKSGKPFLMLKCLTDGRHFRGFIYNQTFIARITAASKTQAV